MFVRREPKAEGLAGALIDEGQAHGLAHREARIQFGIARLGKFGKEELLPRAEPETQAVFGVFGIFQRLKKVVSAQPEPEIQKHAEAQVGKLKLRGKAGNFALSPTDQFDAFHPRKGNLLQGQQNARPAFRKNGHCALETFLIFAEQSD